MPISLDFSYADGTPLNIDAHNLNVNRLKQGLNSGGIDTSMMRHNFSIKRHMIMPDQAIVTRGEASLDSTCLYGDAFGAPNTQYGHESYRTVGGAGIRWYQPYDVTVGWLQWSFFMSHNSWAIHELEEIATWRDSDVEDFILVATVAEYDGFRINNSMRQHSVNCEWPASSWFGEYTKDGFKRSYKFQKPYRRHVETEAHSAKQYDQHLLLCPGLRYTDSEFGIKKGWHELSIKVFLTRPPDYTAQAKYAYFKFEKKTEC